MPLIKSGSKKALKKNIEVEMEANPENKKQDLAIAFDIQRRNKRKKMFNGGEAAPADAVSKGASMSGPEFDEWYKKNHKEPSPSPAPPHYASGGEVEEDLQKLQKMNLASKDDKHPEPHPTMEEEAEKAKRLFADGGEVCSHCEGRGHMSPPEEQEPDEMDDHEPGSMVEAILAKRKFQKLSEGGEVDDPFDNGEGISNFQEEGPGVRQEYNRNARSYNAGDDRQLSKQPNDSNEHGDDREDASENKDDTVSAIRKKMKSGRS